MDLVGEIDDGGRPPESRGSPAREVVMDPVLALVRLIEMNVGIDGTGEHQKPLGIHFLISRKPQLGSHGSNGLTLYEHILLGHVLSNNDGAISDQDGLFVHENPLGWGWGETRGCGKLEPGVPIDKEGDGPSLKMAGQTSRHSPGGRTMGPTSSLKVRTP